MAQALVLLIMIPKVIHYIWLGEKHKPKSFDVVLASWRKYAAIYEVKEWNESNISEFHLPEYYHRSIKNKKWAFASDVLRFHILEKYGGVYLDVDEVLIRNIDTEELSKKEFYVARYHEVQNYYGCGFIGSVPNAQVVREINRYYKEYANTGDIIVNKIVSNIINSVRKENSDIVHVFNQEYFYPLTMKDRTEYTYAYHMSNTSWIPWWKKVLYTIPGYIHIQRVFKKSLPKSIRERIFKIDYL